MKVILQPGGPTSEQNQYTGPARQLTIDVTRSELRLHDGVTPGGIRIVGLEQLQTIFRASGEDPLAGGLPDSGTGIVIRVDAGEYALRTLAAGVLFALTHADGLGGDPTINLEDFPLGTVLANITGAEAQPIHVTMANFLAALQAVTDMSMSQAEAEAGSEAAFRFISALRLSEFHAANDPFKAKFFHAQDHKANNTGGGTFTAGAWQTRTLAAPYINDIGAVLASNQIALLAGTYHVEAWGTSNQVGANKLRIHNVTDNTTLLLGDVNVTTTNVQNAAHVGGRFTLAATKTIELQHRCASTSVYGVAANFGVEEVYADIKIWKL